MDTKDTYKIDYLILINKYHKVPKNWEDALRTVSFINPLGEEVIIEEKAYQAYLGLKENLEKEGVFIGLNGALRTFTVYSPASLLHLLGLAGNLELGVAIGDADVEGLLDAFDVLIEGTEHADDLLHALGVDDSVHVMLPLRTDRWDRRGR